MKKCSFLFWSLLILAPILMLLSAKAPDQKKHGADVNTYAQLKALFKNPSSEYRSAPLWDWNDKIDEKGIAFQLQKFKEAGIGGIFVHPRPGLLTDYLSEDWHQLFDFTVKKGAELGMKVWIYDENSYPSGFAGGHVQREMPESYNEGTGLSCEKQSTLKLEDAQYDVILRVEDSRIEDITTNRESFNGKPGNYYLFKKTFGTNNYWTGNKPYVDLIHKGVTEKFMEITMKGYEQKNKADFGKTLPGIFTDEPNLEAAMGPKSSLRWTPDLYEQFSKRWGYDLKPLLPSLIDEVGNWKKVRHDYYSILLEMFIDRWAKPWSDYCEKNNLLWTGHYWEHGWPEPTHGFDEAAFYIYHQQPGVDMLGNQLIPDGQGGQFGNTRAIREVRSAANQSGSNRTLSETYGGAGWEIKFSNFKRLADWQAVLGINFVNQHLSYYTIKGVRKFDYPPTFSYHEPWWDNYKQMGDYLGRISLATASGNQQNKTLVLQPNTTAWMFFARTGSRKMVDTIQKGFKSFVYQLERNHYEYDLGSEFVIKTIGKVNGKELVVGNRSYDLVVIPENMLNLEANTLKCIQEYLMNGGKVLSFTKVIPCVDGEQSDAVAKLIEKYPEQWILAQNSKDQIVRRMMTAKDFSITEGDKQSGELYHQRRILKDGQLLFLTNIDTLNSSPVKISAVGQSIVKLDPMTGAITGLQGKREGANLQLETVIPPLGSMIYYISNVPLEEPQMPTELHADKAAKSIGNISVKPESPNILVIDFLELKSQKLDLPATYFMKAMQKLYEVNKFPMGNPWQHKIQYKQDYLALDTFNTSSAFEATYRFEIAQNVSDKTLAGLRAVAERTELWDVYVNDKQVTPNSDYWIDQSFKTLSIGKLVKRGSNTIRLKANKMSVHAEMMPVYVIGNFRLTPTEKGFEIADQSPIKTGYWKDLGMPFYSQKMDYSQTFAISKTAKGAKVVLGKWNGIVAEVWVNGTKAGLIAQAPYELEVTPWLKKGNNQVTIKVNGSLKNTFGYFYKKNNQWINGPGDWNTAPAKPAMPKEYYFMNYGLTEPFSLIELN